MGVWGSLGILGFPEESCGSFASVFAGQGLLVRVAGEGCQSGEGTGEQGQRGVCLTVCDNSSYSWMRPTYPVLGQWVPNCCCTLLSPGVLLRKAPE